MAKQGWFSHLAVLVLMLILPPVHAKPLQCDKVVLSGEVGWPPYSYMQEGRLIGAGVDLGTLLFGELNIPVEVLPILQQHDLEQALKSGQVDLLVSTYDLPRYDSITRLVIPPYFEDTLAIVVYKDKYFEFKNWHDLMGLTGVTPKNHQLGREFIDFSRTYLNIQSLGDLRFSFRKLAQGEYEYIVGSSQLLQKGMSLYGDQNFEFLPTLVSTENIHFAFSEKSPCKVYAPYFRDRINELSQSDLIYNLVQEHTSAE